MLPLCCFLNVSSGLNRHICPVIVRRQLRTSYVEEVCARTNSHRPLTVGRHKLFPFTASAYEQMCLWNIWCGNSASASSARNGLECRTPVHAWVAKGSFMSEHRIYGINWQRYLTFTELFTGNRCLVQCRCYCIVTWSFPMLLPRLVRSVNDYAKILIAWTGNRTLCMGF